jgi:sensor histidine kinase regulating citrate/malate metabolism
MKHLRFLKGFLFWNLLVVLLLTGGHFVAAINQLFSGYDQIILYILGAVFATFLILFSFYFYKANHLIHQEQLFKETTRLQLEESQKLIQVLKSQRHDFRNQLQIIKVLAQLNKNNEIIKYLESCDSVFDVTNIIATRIDDPIISAMLLVYSAQAKEKDIDFNVDSDLDFSKFDLPPSKVTRILGNIIQNAIEALTELGNYTERSIQVTTWEEPAAYHFMIWNNGPVIQKEIQDKIFSPGFSTKESTGLGLSIVNKLVSELNGGVNLTSSPEFGTEFKIIIPKKAV